MHKPNIAILFGGASAEYPVSLQSAHAVITHMDTQRYVPVLVGITREGRWLRYRGAAANLLDDTWHRPEYCTEAIISPCRRNAGLMEFGKGVRVFTKLDAAFPVLHGPCGEDGTVQGLLELAGIPVVGCGTLASALCMDKDAAHRLVGAAGIAVPKSAVFAAGAALGEMEKAAEALVYPLFVKPVRAGSSFGVSKVEHAEALAAAVETAFAYDDKIMLEEAVDGFEVGCAVLGTDPLTIGELDEVALSGGFFDYTEKYNLITSQIHVPARIPAEQAAEIKQTAAAVFRLLGCSGFARIDFFRTPAGRVVFGEANTIPGFTPHSRYPSMMQAAGLGFGGVVAKLVELAVGP